MAMENPLRALKAEANGLVPPGHLTGQAAPGQLPPGTSFGAAAPAPAAGGGSSSCCPSVYGLAFAQVSFKLCITVCAAGLPAVHWMSSVLRADPGAAASKCDSTLVVQQLHLRQRQVATRPTWPASRARPD